MELVLATTFWERLTGLLRKGCCTQGEVLLFCPCKSVHTFGMRSAIDVAFLDEGGRVVASERNVPPARVRSHPRADAVLERRSDTNRYWPRAGESLLVSFVQATE